MKALAIDRARSAARTWRALQQSMAAALNTPDLQLPMVRLELSRG
jgi:hypothetical protein